MMKLHTSLTSPFGHKCRLVVHLANLSGRVEIVKPDMKSDAFAKLNPLRKVPVLELPDGRSIINSPLIAAYLASLGDGGKIYPSNEDQKWQVLNREALCDGITEAGVLMFMEGMRPESERSVAWIERQSDKIQAGLSGLEAQAPDFKEDINIGLLSLVSALIWFDLRNIIGDWRGQYPSLANWTESFVQHDFYKATAKD